MVGMATKRHPWGARLREARKAAGLTQGSLSERLGIPLATLRNWEQGRTAPPHYLRTLMEEYLKNRA